MFRVLYVMYCCVQDVSCNRISQLPMQITQLKSLRILNVRNNQLVELPSGMHCQTACQSVSFTQSKTSYYDIHWIPAYCLVSLCLCHVRMVSGLPYIHLGICNHILIKFVNTILYRRGVQMVSSTPSKTRWYTLNISILFSIIMSLPQFEWCRGFHTSIWVSAIIY